MKTKRYSIHVSDQDWRDAKSSLLTDDGCENAGVFLCGIAETDSQIRLLVRRFLPVANHQYAQRLEYHLEIAPGFYDKIVSHCLRENLNPVIVHSHPRSHAAFYSASDDEGESRLVRVLEELLPGRVVASLLVTPWSVAGRRLDREGFVALSHARIVGLRIEQLSLSREAPPPTATDIDARYDRQVRAVGAASQRLLRSLHIGIVGLGGTGSAVAEQVVRSGVGAVTLIDDDAVDETNLSRVFGASKRDIGEPKVEVAARHLKRSGEAKIRSINASAIQQSVLMRLRDCDLIFSCVDNDRTRAFLNRFAYQYLIPGIDVGVRLDARTGQVMAAAGRVNVVGVGATCLRCSHHLDPERIRAESLPPDERGRLAREGYVMGVADPAPSVIALNTVVAGLGATAFLNLFTALTGGPQPGGQIYDATSGSVFPTSPVHDRGCDVCDEIAGLKAIGDRQIVSAY